MDEYITAIKASGAADGVDEIFMPGEIEFRTEQRYLKEGVPLAPATVEELTELARRLGLEFKAGA